MRGLLRAELLKHRTTRTDLGLLVSMLGLVLLVVLLHGLSLPAADVNRRSVQLTEIIGRGGTMGTMFAALLGAMSITGEFRHGTIRPTLLATPRRGRVLAAKVSASLLIGAGFGLAAAAVAAGVGSVALASRNVQVQLDAGDFALILIGGAAAAALWAAIGVAVGSVVRNQVPTVVGTCTWLLFVEGLLVGDTGVLGDVGRYLPGALANAASGQVASVGPAVGLLLLGLYAATVAAVGLLVTTRVDVA